MENTTWKIQHVNKTHHKTCIQHKHVTFIQHPSRKLSGKEKIDFVEVKKRGHMYLYRVIIQFILTHNANKAKGRGKIKIY